MKFFILLFLLSITSIINAQTGQWFLFGIEDTVTGISGHDKEIWTSTQNAGIQMLNKNNGEIKIFDTNSGIVSTNRFRSIKYLNESVYAGTFTDGFYLFQNNQWSHYDTINSDLPGNNITDFIFDSINQAVWIATDKGLAKFKDNNWVIFDSINSDLVGNVLTCLFLDENNVLWIGTRFSGMSKLEDGIFTTFNYDNAGLNNNWVRTIFGDTSGMMYVADFFGVDKYDPVNDDWLYVFNLMTSGLTNERVNKMAQDQDFNLWFASHEGVTKWDMMANWEQFYTTNSLLPHNTIDGLFIDNDNLVWVGTQGGLAAYNANGYQFPEFENEMSVYPNPFSSTISLDLRDADHISIYDLAGNLIFETNSNTSITGEFKIEINLDQYANGIYLIRATFGSSAKIQKIVKL